MEIESAAFKDGRLTYKLRQEGKLSKTDCENPYDPDCTDYEDYNDGWVHERELKFNEKMATNNNT